jgi:hypothetical protein
MAEIITPKNILEDVLRNLPYHLPASTLQRWSNHLTNWMLAGFFSTVIVAIILMYIGVKHGQGLLYTSGELPRLMRSAPPRRAAIAA